MATQSLIFPDDETDHLETIDKLFDGLNDCPLISQYESILNVTLT